MKCVIETYLSFMRCVPNFFDKLNALFQHRKNIIAELQTETARAASLHALKLASKMKYEAHKFAMKCFIKQLSSRSRKGSSFPEVNLIAPALCVEARVELPVLPVLRTRHAYLLLDPENIEQEWRSLPSYFTSHEKDPLKNKE
ncbi:uncharacterized protein LOC142578312 [Dermacentor variabilis]|uniref:uncharacterized protein LOC142578312 n=1 Tax=Dermacentor variabilis TaxID=34621 RepID=UPI003F5B8173